MHAWATTCAFRFRRRAQPNSSATASAASTSRHSRAISDNRWCTTTKTSYGILVRLLRRAALASLQAPDFELPDLDGKMHRLSDYRGKKVLLAAWASWLGCRHDLPVWQGLYEELKDKGFTIIAIALDSAGAPAVREFIRPASIELPPLLKDGMGWDDGFTSRAGIPQYPCLIAQKHILGELYEFINVLVREGPSRRRAEIFRRSAPAASGELEL